jgi:hypothetical protein
MHLNLFQAVEKANDYPKYNHVFLLDESRFSFFRFDIFQEFEEKITITNIQEVIDEKISLIKQQRDIPDEIISTYIDTIYVDGDQKKFLI